MSDYYQELDQSPWEHEKDGWRSRLVQSLRFEAVRRGLLIGEEDDVLDLGCGGGRLLEHLGSERKGRYLGVDLRTEAIERAALRKGGSFRCLDIWSEEVDREGPFDFAVAIGALVSGAPRGGDRERRDGFERLVKRLDGLGKKGWALVVLDQDDLERDRIRLLEPSLTGVRKREALAALQRCKGAAWVEDRILPGELMLFCDRSLSLEEKRRLDWETLTGAVLGAEETDPLEEARFWLALKRRERGIKALEKVAGEPEAVRVLLAKLELLGS